MNEISGCPVIYLTCYTHIFQYVTLFVSFLPPHVSQRGCNRQTVKSVLGRM